MKYKVKNLYLVLIYRYSDKSRTYKLIKCKFATKRHVKNKAFGSYSTDTIKCIDGLKYVIRESYGQPSALDALPFSVFIDMYNNDVGPSEKITQKKFSFDELMMIQEQVYSEISGNNKSEENRKTVSLTNLDIGDLF